MNGMLQAFLLAGLSGLCSVVAYFAHPSAPALRLANDEIGLDEAKSFSPVHWVDAREESDYARGHLEGALLLNEDDWELHFSAFMENWNPDVAIIVYCSSSACLRSQDVASRLREELGIENVYVLKGGWTTLLQADLVQEVAP